MQQKVNFNKLHLIEDIEKYKNNLINNFEEINNSLKDIGINIKKLSSEYEEFFTLLIWHIKRAKFKVNKFELNSDTLCYLEKLITKNLKFNNSFNVYTKYFIDGLLKNINNTLNDILNKCYNQSTIHYLNLYLYSWEFCNIPSEIILYRDDFNSEKIIVNNRYDFCHYVNKINYNSRVDKK